MCVHVRVHSCMAIDTVIIIATSINSAYTTSMILHYLLCMNNMFLVMLKYYIYTYAIYSFVVMNIIHDGFNETMIYVATYVYICMYVYILHGHASMYS